MVQFVTSSVTVLEAAIWVKLVSAKWQNPNGKKDKMGMNKFLHEFQSRGSV